MPCASSGLCRTEGAEAPCCLSGTTYSITRSCGVRYVLRSVSGYRYKDRMLPSGGYASRRSLFCPCNLCRNPFSVCCRVLFQMNFPRRSRTENSFENRKQTRLANGKGVSFDGRGKQCFSQADCISVFREGECQDS